MDKYIFNGVAWRMKNPIFSTEDAQRSEPIYWTIACGIILICLIVIGIRWFAGG
jgi:hypothetical protein